MLAAAGAAVVLFHGGSSGPKPVAPISTMSAIRAKAKSGTRPFIIKGTLAPVLATYFGGSSITGQGIANFSTNSAKWNLTVPDRVGGTIAVFAQHARSTSTSAQPDDGCCSNQSATTPATTRSPSSGTWSCSRTRSGR